MKCPKCNSENPDDTRFCGNCTTPLHPSEEISASLTETLHTPKRELMIGSMFAGKYKIIEELGKGGMGIVYKAEDTKLKRAVALKFLPPDLIRDSEVKERFVQEAQAASALEHNNICTIHEIDETKDGQMFICMSYYEGETLKRKIENGPLMLEEAIEIAIQVAQGLAKAHKTHIIHRDIKPANIMITDDGVVKIVDFGLAKLAGQTRLTQTGTTMGTIAYMSPEQSRGEAVDHRTDIWSLGLVLYEMLTGQLPFKGEYEQAVVYSILNEEPERVTSLRSEAPLELEQIIKKAMRKNSEKRYSQVDEIISSLRSLKKKLESLRPEKSEAEVRLIRKKRLYIYGAITILALSFIVTAFFLWRKTETGRIKAIVSRLKPAVEAGRFDEVFEILNYSGVEIKDDRINTLTKQVAGNLSIQSTPPRARVTLARVRSAPALSAGEPIDIGLTPIKEHMLVAGEYFVSMMLENMMPVEFLLQVVPGESLKINRTLLSTNKELSGMVKIEKGVSQNGIPIPAFFIDKHEVTNAEFFNFITAGGYRIKKFWPENIIINGNQTSWESAIRSFTDQTGIPGPRFWSGGKHPEGKDDYPVVGISWYEAMVFARWQGKDLPTWDQLWLAALGETDSVFPWGNDVKTTHLRANFGLKGTQPVGSYPLGVSPFGCLDMAGNVREWLRDSASRGKLPTVVGGSWKDPSYMFEPSHAESFHPDFASEAIGFRCVKSISDEK